MISLFADHRNTRAVNTMMWIAKSRLDAGRSPAPWYRAAGQHLAKLRHGRTKDKWCQILRDECGLGLSRAYELIALGNGKSLAKARAETSARVKKKRTRKRLAQEQHP